VVALDANKGFAGEGQRSLFKVVAAWRHHRCLLIPEWAPSQQVRS
jgi:hypothetical protein